VLEGNLFLPAGRQVLVRFLWASKENEQQLRYQIVKYQIFIGISRFCIVKLLIFTNAANYFVGNNCFS
jgi:hypothetical protein